MPSLRGRAADRVDRAERWLERIQEPVILVSTFGVFGGFAVAGLRYADALPGAVMIPLVALVILMISGGAMIVTVQLALTLVEFLLRLPDLLVGRDAATVRRSTTDQDP
ncbi:hypothetical protein [Krasilnikovia sp. MM14-A1004]|uniref:hypothetical protein n=1 Tax=Krasilnikovia sp. MM14-A1004 TaxID=3373541 RepID=UPI00399CD329